jgi:hypothetical protein
VYVTTTERRDIKDHPLVASQQTSASASRQTYALTYG